MIELLEQADPARSVIIDKTSLRARVDSKIGRPAVRPRKPTRRRWVAALGSTALAAIVLVVLQPSQPVDALSVMTPSLGDLGGLRGIDTVVTLEMGGVKTMAADGNTIWVMESLHHRLDRIDSTVGVVESSYPVDDYAEGVVVGGGYLWLLSYDEGGRVLRFDPDAGRIDTRIPLGGTPESGAVWFAGSLWVGTDTGQTVQIAPSGEIVNTISGELKGEALEHLWLNDPETGLISSVSESGTRGDFEIPTVPGKETADGFGVREVVGAGDSLYLVDGMYPWGTNLSRFDPSTGEFRSFAGITFGLLDVVEYEGALWLTSHTDHLLVRVDPDTGSVTRYPLPGKAGALLVVDGELWVSLYHPGAVVRVEPDRLHESSPIVADDWNRYPHRLLCTGPETPPDPTVILEPYEWIDFGMWSVIQARLSAEGYLVCANGYVQGDVSPQARAADLEAALSETGINGPYILVGAGDGVHALREFADGRTDIAGVVLVDPMPVGFPPFLADLIEDGAHPAWSDLTPNESSSLGDFGSIPLTVIEQDPEATFLSERALHGLGQSTAHMLDAYWQEGLSFYEGLSTNSRTVVALGTGMHMVVWNSPDLVVSEIGALGDATP